MPDWVSAYNLLPQPLKVLAASLYGWNLRRIRYSEDTEQRAAEALSRERWSRQRWDAWQHDRLTELLEHAAESVPFYRGQWEARRRRGDRSSVGRLSRWPVLSKESVRSSSRSLVADGTHLPSQIAEHTSGTTGKPLTLWISRDAVRQWYALVEARWRGWYGLTRHDRWGILGGQLVTPFNQLRPPYWVWNAGLNQLYLSAHHIAPQKISAYAGAIRHHRLVYIVGYPSALYSLAQLGLEQGIQFPQLRVVISNAEPLYVHQREVISRAFQCPVRDSYGLSENVCAASECSEGRLHLWPEAGVIEILADDSDDPVPQGRVGRIVCTGLLNFSMPLIRYDTGDRGFLSAQAGCECGRKLPILGGIEGRKDDVLITRDGRRIGRLDPVFKTNLAIREAQIIQESLERVAVHYVPAAGCTKKDLDRLARNIRDRLGAVQIEMTEVDRVPRSANGKFRAVISHIS